MICGERDAVMPAPCADAAPACAERQVPAGTGRSPHYESAGEFNRIVTGLVWR